MQDQPSDNIDLSKLGSASNQESVTYSPDPALASGSINDNATQTETPLANPAKPTFLDTGITGGIAIDLSSPQQIPGQIIAPPQNSHPEGLNVLNPPSIQ